MPNYDYACSSCGFSREETQKISDPPLHTCPQCQKECYQKRPSTVGLAFKGSGFYINDYARGPSNESASSAASPCCPCGKGKGACNTSS